MLLNQHPFPIPISKYKGMPPWKENEIFLSLEPVGEPGVSPSGFRKTAITQEPFNFFANILHHFVGFFFLTFPIFFLTFPKVVRCVSKEKQTQNFDRLIFLRGNVGHSLF